MRYKPSQEQRKILKHNNRVGLIMAGAGTGKTTTLLAYIVDQILNNGAEPEEFLVLSFSQAAGKEFSERLLRLRTTRGLSLMSLDKVKVMTYDAFGYQVIYANHGHLGFQSKPSVVTKTKLLNKHIEWVARKNEVKRKELAKEVANYKQTQSEEKSNDHLVSLVMKGYNKSKKKRNLVDFDDMTRLFQGERQSLLVREAKQYRYLLVDELQDTNALQAQMLITLAEVIPTVLMVGDPKQNIYEFRGADAQNWYSIKKALKPKCYQLTKTYRIPEQSLPFVNGIGEQIQPGTQLTSDIDGKPVHYIQCDDCGRQQAQYIAEEIKRLVKAKLAKPEEIAILGRTRRMMSDLSIELSVHGIKGIESYRELTESHLKGLRNLIRLVSFLKANKDKKGIVFSEKRQATISLHLKRLGASEEEIQTVLEAFPRRGWKAFSVKSKVNIKGKDKEPPHYRRINEFRTSIEKAVTSDNPEKAILRLTKAMGILLRRKHEKLSLHILILELTEVEVMFRQYKSWSDIRLKNINIDRADSGVYLGTMNSAKGKEWKYVFVINCVDGVIPFRGYKNLIDSEAEHRLLAEKRLLYVASTRHKKCLYLIKSPAGMISYVNGRRDTELKDHSPFIEEFKRVLVKKKCRSR